MFSNPWDHHSDQPAMIGDRALRKALRRNAAGAMIREGILGGLATAAGMLRQFFVPSLMKPPGAMNAFLGTAISPHPQGPGLICELIQELDVQRLSMRVPLEPGPEQTAALDLIAALPTHPILVTLCQSRHHVVDHRLWLRHLEATCKMLPAHITELQIGNAVNRLKWGCASIEEYLDLVGTGWSALKPRFTVAGSAVIDFEPLATGRTLLHNHPWVLDACSALLYVDRRGGPDNKQYGFYDFPKKLALTAAQVANSRRCQNRLWLTEVNWPLKGTAPFAPTSEKECVSPEEAATHLQRYCTLAHASGLAERCYIWQLIAPGYGLVDDRNGIERRPAFAAVKNLLAAPTEGSVG